MGTIDWIVLIGSLVCIVAYGVYKSRGTKNIETFLLANKTMPWYAVGLSVMATQASAITFLSAPGQGFTDGMGFVQFYFGLPIAMVILSITAIPIFYKLKVFTAYEYLETRFDLKTRSLAAFLFLIQRGLSTGLTIYAPSIILSSILGWNIYYTNVIIGGLVIAYTVVGGTKAVSYTHLQQMAVIFAGMFLAGYLIVKMLPPQVSFTDAISIAGKMDKLNLIDLEWDWNKRYNIWSGIIGGLFLALSYFGTDQSQVGRYLSGESVKQSRLGLLFNGIVKIPMQFSILFIGAMLFVFYLFHQPPVFFNKMQLEKTYQSTKADSLRMLEDQYGQIFKEKQDDLNRMVEGLHSKDENKIQQSKENLQRATREEKEIRKDVAGLMERADRTADTNDTNYIFLNFVTRYLPEGLIGLIIAVIFAASMSSTSSALNALASTSIIDIYKRNINANGSDRHYLNVSRILTVAWGIFVIIVAGFASKLGSLIEAVNVLGSLFYGTILGIFLVAFYFKSIKGSAAFYAAIIAEVIVIWCYFNTEISFLWFNVIGCLSVIIIALAIDLLKKQNRSHT